MIYSFYGTPVHCSPYLYYRQIYLKFENQRNQWIIFNKYSDVLQLLKLFSIGDSHYWKAQLKRFRVLWHFFTP